MSQGDSGRFRVGENRDTGVMLKEFRKVVLAWDAAQANANLANPLFDRMHELAKELRTMPEGRKGLSALMGDENRAVRLSAASACLAWDADSAVAVLEALQSPRGRYSIDAEYTLQGYREGSLNLNW